MTLTNKLTSKDCIVPNKKGLHARAAAQIVTLCNQFNADIQINHKCKTAAGLSLIKLLTLDAPQGSTLTICATGIDADKAVKSVTQLVLSGFGEDI